MKAKDVQIGSLYYAKVSSKIQPVRITSRAERYIGPGRGDRMRYYWTGTNTNTGREVRILSAQRLRSLVETEAPHGLA